ncbi:uncharacterized protein ACN2A1_007409 [Glossina fuscipes fuscipes]
MICHYLTTFGCKLFKTKRQLRRDNYINEAKQITNIVVGLVNDRRAPDFKIKEHLRRLSAADFELHATGDFETEFVELTEEHLSLINTATSGPLDQILVSKFHMNISRLDIRTLCDNNWLNDKIIDFYMKLLIERSERKSPSSVLPSVYAMSTFFVPRLMSSGYDAVEKMLRLRNLFDSATRIIHQFYEIIAPSYNDDDDGDDNVEEKITVRNEFDAIPSCNY